MPLVKRVRRAAVVVLLVLLVPVAFVVSTWGVPTVRVLSYFPDVSAELADAPPGPTPEIRVQRWLFRNRVAINRQSRRFRVDPTAVAGVIAYEGLYDFHSSWAVLYRSSGPGKVHYREGHFWEGDPVAKQVEDMGLLPKLSEDQRRQVLTTPNGAAAYIAAIMSVYSGLLRTSGVDLRCNPGLLATFYSAWGFPEAKRRKGSGLRHIRVNDMGEWVNRSRPYLYKSLGDDNSPCPIGRAIPGHHG